MHRKEGGGTTASARIKALLIHVHARSGPDAAASLLLETRLDRDYLEDETRPIPFERWHAGLIAFTRRWGREALAALAPALVAEEVLGAWGRVLRGATAPHEALAQLDGFGGDDTDADRWEVQRAAPGRWRGRLLLVRDPAHERDGLCALARAAELAAVPLLFGWAEGRAQLVRLAVDEGYAEFELCWREARRAFPVGALVGLGLAPLVSTLMDQPPLTAALAGVGGGLGGALAGAWLTQEQRQRARGQAQLLKIQALERLAALREQRERGELGYHAGAVVAGNYRLGRQLGIGASGSIFEATRLSDHAEVAIKLLRTPIAHDTVAADRLRREAAALGLAWHPNVVEVYDDGHLPDGTSYLVMERLHGETLSAKLTESPLEPAEVRRIALEICEALEAVHAAGVIHRDLKPSNIFLVAGAPGEPPRVKLLDFGVARVEWAETRITQAGTPVGTPGYMAPEQEQGMDVDARSDLFALGGVIQECLLGAPPSERRSIEPREHPSGVQRVSRALPRAWRVLLERAMALEPSQRFPDARRFKEALLELDPQQGDPELEPTSAPSAH
ncbi:MAG: serine/threonine protein kinase [Polyangiaceae bacterium]|nr:serine/threonine protein kinase [Polyangiaceae bacterium]MCW5791205.1 serine/threonine protein kinase [Polyangiaceae bacterium]